MTEPQQGLPCCSCRAGRHGTTCAGARCADADRDGLLARFCQGRGFSPSWQGYPRFGSGTIHVLECRLIIVQTYSSFPMRQTWISSIAAWRLWSSISRTNSYRLRHSLLRVSCVLFASPPGSVFNRRQCESYNRLLREAIANEESAPKGDDLEALMDADGEDDKTYAAMGVAKTLSTVGY
jgi:hypothetical protein